MAGKTACVILNYNVASLTVSLAETLVGYSSVSDIVIVDNCSDDKNKEMLLSADGGKIHVVFSDRNGGYGYGNNIGVREAHEKYGSENVLILNPDVEVEENVIIELQRRMSELPGCAVSSARQISPEYPDARSCWRLCGYIGHTLMSLPFLSRIYKKLKNTDEDQFSVHETECVAGSLLLIDAEKFIEVGGYDENFFLYMEEDVLGYRMKGRGYKTLYCGDITYVHNHGSSTSQTFKRESKIFDLLRDSKEKYLRIYLGASKLRIILFRFLSGIGKAETVLWHRLKRNI